MGIYNLTKDQAPVLVHYDEVRTEQWQLIRMDPPKQEDQSEQQAQSG